MTTASEKVPIIKEYRTEDNKVVAVFHHKDYVKEYLKKTPFPQKSQNWHAKVAFADFKLGEDSATIEVYSNYHPVNVLISMFENGLRY